MLQKLDLLSVERDDADPRLVDATLDERLCELANELCFGCILHEVTDARVSRWKVFSVDENGFASKNNEE